MGNLFCRKEKGRILIQGLDAAGKTSLLYKLKLGEVVTTIPTIGFNVETINFGGIEITCWDLGGRDKIRPLYRHYYPNTDGFIYVIDSNDRERLDDAIEELVRFVLLQDEAKDTVLMVMANKQDLAGALTAQEVEEALKKKYTFSKTCSHTVFVKPCSVTSGEGIEEALEFFANQLHLNKSGKLERGLISQSELAAQKETEKTSQLKEEQLAWKYLLKNPFGYIKSFLF